MKHSLVRSTGFVTNPNPQALMFSEVLHKALPDPTEEIGRLTFSAATNSKDNKIYELIKKASIAYLVDGMVRQSVDKFAEMFKAFDFDGEEEIVKYLKGRLTEMTLQTGEHWETTITRIIHEYFKTGNTFIVKRRGGNTSSTKRALYKNKPASLSGLSIVSPDRLEISLNNNGEMEGWKITGTKDDANLNLVAYGAKRFPVSNCLINIGTLPDKKNVLVPGLDIVHIAYKKGADSNFGFGLTLAALEDVSMVRTLEQITAVMIKKFSNPIIHHKILRASNPLAGITQEINAAYDTYRRMSPDGILITGGNAEIKAVGSESQALRVEGYLKYFLNRSLAGLGVSPYLLGLEGAGLGTAESAIELVMQKVRFCQAEISREIEMFIINEILWEGGYDPYTNEEHRVKLVFEDIDEERNIKIETHAADMFSKNMWGLEESRKMTRTRKKLDETDLYLNRIDIPKSRSEAEAKGSAQKDAGVAIAKARPRPASTKKRKEVLEVLDTLIPQTEENLLVFMGILERLCGVDHKVLFDSYESCKNLLHDPEAFKLHILEIVSNGKIAED